MEYALEEIVKAVTHEYVQKVLILVLMEYALEEL